MAESRTELAALLNNALARRADDAGLPRMPRKPRSTANVNNPFKPEYRRTPRGDDPAKWAPPAYRDRDAERVVGRLSKEKNR